MPPMPEDWRARFQRKFRPAGPDDCWEWQGHIGLRGYGQIRMDAGGRREQSHRAAYLFHCGAIPDGMWVLHSCDNKKCVNPRHLHLGTVADNSREASDRGLYVTGANWGAAHTAALLRGEAHQNARLTERQVIQIRNSAQSCAQLGREFGVAPITISRIKRRLAWSHVGA